MRTRKLFALVLGVATIAMIAAACSGGGGLTGKTWQLTAITEKVPAFQGVVPAADQANYTITFEPNGTFSAKADCNQLSGDYTTTGVEWADDRAGPDDPCRLSSGGWLSEPVRGGARQGRDLRGRQRPS